MRKRLWYKVVQQLLKALMKLLLACDQFYQLLLVN